MKLRRSKNKEPSVVVRRRPQQTAPRPVAFSSYHANRSEQEYTVGRAQPRDQDIRRQERLVKFWRQRLSGLVVGFVVIGVLGIVLHVSGSPRVVVLSSTSNNTFLRPTDVYQQAASTLLDSSAWNGNKITINTSQIQQKLQQEFPELSGISISLPLINSRPVVYIAPTMPSLLLSTRGGSYVLSSGGVALLSSGQLSNANRLALPTVTDQTNTKVKIGQEALPSSSITFIKTVVAELHAKNLTVASMTLPTAAAYELDVQPSGVGYYVKFNLHDTSGARQQAGTFLAVMQHLQSQGVTPASYIDVRLSGRAYYK